MLTMDLVFILAWAFPITMALLYRFFIVPLRLAEIEEVFLGVDLAKVHGEEGSSARDRGHAANSAALATEQAQARPETVLDGTGAACQYFVIFGSFPTSYGWTREAAVAQFRRRF